MHPESNRRDFLKAAGTAAAVAAAGLPIQTAEAKEKETVSNDEIVPGMRAQGKGIKCYVETEYAPLKACIVGNPDSLWIPDPQFPEIANMFAHATEEARAYLRKYKNTNLKDSDPKTYDQMALESNTLAETYRKAGVRVIRFEGEARKEIVNYAYGWSGIKHNSILAKSSFNVIGHCMVSTWEVTCNLAMELKHREAVNEVMQNDPEAVWLTMPVPYPATGKTFPGPTLSPGDPRIFDKVVVVGIGVADPSHIQDLSKPRSSGTEYGAEMLRRMLKPFGWRVETVYFDSRIAYHIDCVMTVLEEGLLAMPKNSLWTQLPKEFSDWKVFDVDRGEVDAGACNNAVLGKKQLVMIDQAPKFARDLQKHGWTPIEIPYSTTYRVTGSGINCSTAPIWREKT